MDRHEKKGLKNLTKESGELKGEEGTVTGVESSTEGKKIETQQQMRVPRLLGHDSQS